MLSSCFEKYESLICLQSSLDQSTKLKLVPEHSVWAAVCGRYAQLPTVLNTYYGLKADKKISYGDY